MGFDLVDRHRLHDHLRGHFLALVTYVWLADKNSPYPFDDVEMSRFETYRHLVGAAHPCPNALTMPRSALQPVADHLADECRASPDAGHPDTVKLYRMSPQHYVAALGCAH